MKKTKAFQASDGQLFLDGGKLATHEVRQIILSEIPKSETSEALAEKIAVALIKKHEVLFEAVKLLRAPVKRKSKTAATPAVTTTKK